MSARIGLLRAVNVGGRSLLMADLKAMITALGFENVRTLMQSGNVVFDAGSDSDAEIERQLEAATEARFGIITDYMVRDAAEWRAMINANPFPHEAADDPGHLIVMSMKTAIDPDAVPKLQAWIKGPERVLAAGRHAYVVYPDGSGNSKLTIKVIEKHLGAHGTGRNWNTVQKLAAMVEDVT